MIVEFLSCPLVLDPAEFRCVLKFRPAQEGEISRDVSRLISRYLVEAAGMLGGCAALSLPSVGTDVAARRRPALACGSLVEP